MLNYKWNDDNCTLLISSYLLYCYNALSLPHSMPSNKGTLIHPHWIELKNQSYAFILLLNTCFQSNLLQKDNHY